MTVISKHMFILHFHILSVQPVEVFYAFRGYLHHIYKAECQA